MSQLGQLDQSLQLEALEAVLPELVEMDVRKWGCPQLLGSPRKSEGFSPSGPCDFGDSKMVDFPHLSYVICHMYPHLYCLIYYDM